MTKPYKNIINGALAILTLAACSSDVDRPDKTEMTDCPDFTAYIGDATSRAVDNRWEAADEIGISGAERTNVCYLTEDGNGVFTVKTSGDQIYFPNDNETTFTAYYPWSVGIGANSVIDTDTRQQTRQKSFDFLWARASGKKSQPSVAFNFAHKMVKLVLTVKTGNGMSFDEAKTAILSMEGYGHAGMFDVSNGIAAIDGDAAKEKWVFAGADKNVSYITTGENSLVCSLILFPQVLEAPLTFSADFSSHSLMAKVDFTSANSTQDGTDARNEWVAGRQYNLTLTLHKTEITLENCTITPWTVIEGDDIVVE